MRPKFKLFAIDTIGRFSGGKWGGRIRPASTPSVKYGGGSLMYYVYFGACDKIDGIMISTKYPFYFPIFSPVIDRSLLSAATSWVVKTKESAVYPLLYT